MKRVRVATCAGFAALALPALAQPPAGIESLSAAFNVSPLRIELDSGEASEQMQVRNESRDTMAVQVRIFGWSQEDGEDHYAPSDDFIASPSIIRINPDDTQTFRLLRKRPGPAAGEARYRVVIDQLPAANGTQPAAATTRLRITIPLFASRDKASPAEILWSVQDGRLTARNVGGRTVRLSALKLTDGDGGLPLEPADGRYLLGGSSLSWTLKTKPNCAVRAMKVAGTIDQKNFDATPAFTCT